MWNAKTPGIPDELFDRDENVPITKEEVRVVQISKARLKPGMIVYDIGCGSGSISVEAAHQVEESGHVHAVDYDAKAVELTKKNLEKFNLANVSVILGNAKEKISELPNADAVFIGGTGTDTNEIMHICQDKLKSGGRIVIGMILIETIFSILSSIKELDFDSIDITQVTIAKSRRTTTGTMMLARNPVTILSATKK
ncbi:MAG: precorrin-6Y C5,15-methyltransferase (decarboxylating) subunit CbiT [Candidatus Nitrosopelagicus sp.]|jgi:cobalt-precorrin-6B (C15)-methyltransferase|nr:precorrin-6Y C5,15-methyltransferase (decarboxylating) subunit CbiT [Candidatus Nitrosopelagicus sp.]